MEFIQENYVEEIDSEQLIENALKGMAGELDDYSGYLTKEEFTEKQIELEGIYGGIGLVVTMRNDRLTVVSPINNTPGEKAGIKARDIIIEINGESTADLTLQNAVNLMRGEPDIAVKLTIFREGKEESFTVEIIRAEIEVPYVSGEIIDDILGYIAVSQFMDDVGRKIEREISSLKEKGAQGIILDLRNNPGGILQEAVNAASNFIEEGTIVTVKQRIEADRIWETNKDIKTTNLPLVVLINLGSASGSEIVAGAIRDYERGTLVGTTTFGKGSVQNLIPLTDGTALRMTTANFYLPSGVHIQEEGIEPDIIIEYDPEYESVEEPDTPEDNIDETDIEENNGLFIDNQLAKAIEILKDKIADQSHQ